MQILNRLWPVALFVLLSMDVSAGSLGSRLASASAQDAILIVEVPSLSGFLTKADRLGEIYSAQVSTMFSFLAAPAIFRSTQSNQIDLTKSILFVLTDPSQSSNPVTYCVTVKDAPTFLQGLGEAGESAGGVTAYTSPQGTFYAAADGEEVVVSGSQAFAAAVLQAQPGDGLLPTIQGDFQVRVEIASLMKKYGPALEEAKPLMEKAMQGSGQNPEMAKFVAEFYVNLFTGLGSQTDRAEFGLALEGPDLFVYKELHPVKGSKLEKFLQAQGGQKLDLGSVLPQSSVMEFQIVLRSSPELVEAYAQMMEYFAKTYTADSSFAKIRPQFEQFLERMGPRYFGALLANEPNQTGLQFVQAFDFQGSHEFSEIFETIMNAWMPQLQEMYSKMGMPMQVKFGKTATGASEMVFDMQGIPESQKPIFEKLYGGTQLRILMQPHKNFILSTMGPNPEQLLQAWGPKFEGLSLNSEAKGTFLASMNLDLAAYMELIFSVLPGEQADKARAEMQKFIESKPVLKMDATVENGVVKAVMSYPLEDTLRATKK